ncbi:LPP20 family lipoprotein [Limisalsivibrio acetivorans]|uniref:LPP20 family lipoprotein n=1 Tax=Limisalsivibrio acetivorans TaxID=1304888 RepID=UPI0003B2E31B|nr:LPP20 family lipoprotein [Limisalsivibrio acetivorans]
MKKLLVLVLAVAFLTAACGGKKPEKKLANPCFEGAPSWVLTPELEGSIAASGSAKIGAAGVQFAKTEAMASGRDEIARIMSVKVKNMVKNFTQQTGVGDDQVVDKVSAQVSKQVANQTLTGSRQKDIWVSPCNELYVLVALDPGSVQQAVKESVRTSFKNEQALWQQFQAKKAQDELDAEIEKEFGR